MSDAEHPAYRELLLLDSGELDAERVRPVEEHVAGCSECQAELAKIRSVCTTVAASIKRHDSRGGRSFVNRRARATVAAVVAIAVTGYLLMEGTPAARADEMLRRAVAQQSSEPSRIRTLRVRGAKGQCTADGAGIQETAASGDNAFCRSISSALRSARWAGTDLLSATRFQSWRASLSSKKDDVRKANDSIEVETTTEEGPLRLASLRIRDSDYRPVVAHYEFLVDRESTTFDVFEAEPAALTVSEEPKPLSTKRPATPNSRGAQPEADPADLRETRIRLALHAAHADGSVMLDLEKNPSDFRIWGVVPDEQAKQSIRQNLEGIQGVSIEVATEAESQQAEQPPPTPWVGFHGDAPPLAQEELSELFRNNPQGRQQFLNGLDLATRQLAGETKTRDALRDLAQRMNASPEGAALNQAASDLDDRVARSLQEIARDLEPLIGAGPPATGQKLTFPEAMDLYTIVHQTVLLSTGTSDLTLPQALDRITALLQ